MNDAELAEGLDELAAGDELEDDEQAAADEQEGEAPPEQLEPQAALSEVDVDRAIAKLEREATRHANRVSEIMGADAQELESCPLCAPAIPGFRFPVPVDDEQRAAVLVTLGVDPDPEYVAADDARACDYCKALGKVSTGSNVPEHRTKLCGHCGGTGWQMVSATPTPPPTHENGKPPLELAVVAGPAGPEPDAWGRPVGHKHYGLHPAYID